MTDEPRAKVVRFYKSGRKKTILKNVPLSIAKLHCNSPRTEGKNFFDGFYILKGKE